VSYVALHVAVTYYTTLASVMEILSAIEIELLWLINSRSIFSDFCYR